MASGQYGMDPETIALSAGQIEITPRNKDGLVIPSTKRFGVCVGIYKVLLTLGSLCLGLVFIVMCLSPLAIDSIRESAKKMEDPKERDHLLHMIDLFQTMLPSIIVGVLFGILQNLIAWAGMKTFRLRLVFVKMEKISTNSEERITFRPRIASCQPLFSPKIVLHSVWLLI
jgi:hypothetical protein